MKSSSRNVNETADSDSILSFSDASNKGEEQVTSTTTSKISSTKPDEPNATSTTSTKILLPPCTRAGRYFSRRCAESSEKK